MDCPGQIELFTHIPVLRTFVDYMKRDGWNVCAIYCLDAHFITDSAKFISGCFQALSAMITLEVAHVNVLTKVDLLENKVWTYTLAFAVSMIWPQGLHPGLQTAPGR